MQQAIDFKFECDCLSSVLKDLNNHDFKQITQFKNWTIEDILGHLHLFNVAADITLESDLKFDAFFADITKELNRGKSLLQA